MHVVRKLALLSVVACAGSALAAVPVRAAYPERPIELIVPWGPGGGADQLARLVSKLAEPLLGQGIPVVNVPGATGGTGMAKLLAAPADGYSAAIYIADSHVLLTGKNPRWSMNDIAPVAVMIEVPSFIFVAQNSRFKTWQDFENEAKANPGKLKIATLGFGSVDDLSIGVIERSKGLKFVQVPFSKPSERYASILGGHADALYEQAGDVASFLNNKQMRPLLIFGKQRLGFRAQTMGLFDFVGDCGRARIERAGDQRRHTFPDDDADEDQRADSDPEFGIAQELHISFLSLRWRRGRPQPPPC